MATSHLILVELISVLQQTPGGRENMSIEFECTRLIHCRKCVRLVVKVPEQANTRQWV